MFKKKFKVVEIRDNGITITHFITGTRKEIKENIKYFKEHSKKYFMFESHGMIVWA